MQKLVAQCIAKINAIDSVPAEKNGNFLFEKVAVFLKLIYKSNSVDNYRRLLNFVNSNLNVDPNTDPDAEPNADSCKSDNEMNRDKIIGLENELNFLRDGLVKLGGSLELVFSHNDLSQENIFQRLDSLNRIYVLGCDLAGYNFRGYDLGRQLIFSVDLIDLLQFLETLLDSIWIANFRPISLPRLRQREMLPTEMAILNSKINSLNSLKSLKLAKPLLRLFILRLIAHFLNNIAFDLDAPPSDLNQMRWISDAELSEFLEHYLSKLTVLKGEQTVDLIKEVKFFRLFSSYLSMLVSFLTTLTSEPIESNLVSLLTL